MNQGTRRGSGDILLRRLHGNWLRRWHHGAPWRVPAGEAWRRRGARALGDPRARHEHDAASNKRPGVTSA